MIERVIGARTFASGGVGFTALLGDGAQRFLSTEAVNDSEEVIGQETTSILLRIFCLLESNSLSGVSVSRHGSAAGKFRSPLRGGSEAVLAGIGAVLFRAQDLVVYKEWLLMS
jgi:hypothetical protein